MPFSEAQKSQFIAILENQGWTLQEDAICSPGGGLWFDNSHFQSWSPIEMRDTFAVRADRIERAAHENWERAANENRQASLAAAAALNGG